MKKLILLMILGVVLFIGGQWLGLVISETKRSQQAPLTETTSALETLEK